MQIDDDDDGGLGMPAAKRVGPDDVEPVQVGRTRYEAIHWGRERGLGQNGGFLAAVDVDSGKELWTLKVYDVVYDPDMEEDVQDVFITALAPGPQPDSLSVTDERGGQYLLDTRTRAVRVVQPRGK